MASYLHALPRFTPPLSAMLADLGQPTPAQVAQALGVTTRTVHRWIAQDRAPRPAALALYWVTRWGRSSVECTAVNDARLMAAQARAALALAQVTQKQNAHLLRVGVFGAANAPLAGDG